MPGDRPIIVKGLTIRYPESTALALASAAFQFCMRAGVRKEKRKSLRLHRAIREHLEPYGGLGVTGAQREARRTAIETLRSNPEARAEALAAIQRAYPKEEPFSSWLVNAFAGPGSVIELVELIHPEQESG